MKNFFKIAGVVALLLLVYSLLQGLFMILALGGYVIYGATTETMEPKALSEIYVFKEYGADAMSISLFLSAITMLVFIHVKKLFCIRKTLFTSIALKPLLLSTALVMTAIYTFNVLVQWLPLENLLESEFDVMSHTVIGALTISVIAPVLEEVMFRGAIQGYMMRHMRSPWAAMVAAALVFGIFHMNPVQVVYASLLGFVFGWLYYRTGSLMSVIVGHVLNNSLATILLLVLGKGNEFEILNDHISSEADLASEVVSFIFFGALTVYLAVKLHRSLPPVPSPWRESDEDVQSVEEKEL